MAPSSGEVAVRSMVPPAPEQDFPESGVTAPVGRIVRLDVEPVDASWPLERALQTMRAGRYAAVPVMMRGQLVGLLTLENVSELLMVQEARQRHAGVA